MIPVSFAKIQYDKLIKTMGEESIELHVEPGVNEHKFYIGGMKATQVFL